MKYASNPSFRVRIQIGASCRQPHDFHPRPLEHFAKRPRAERIAVEDQIFRVLEKPINQPRARKRNVVMLGFRADARQRKAITCATRFEVFPLARCRR